MDRILWREWPQELEACYWLGKELFKSILLGRLDDLVDTNLDERLHLVDSFEVELMVESED